MTVNIFIYLIQDLNNPTVCVFFFFLLPFLWKHFKYDCALNGVMYASVKSARANAKKPLKSIWKTGIGAIVCRQISTLRTRIQIKHAYGELPNHAHDALAHRVYRFTCGEGDCRRGNEGRKENNSKGNMWTWVDLITWSWSFRQIKHLRLFMTLCGYLSCSESPVKIYLLWNDCLGAGILRLFYVQKT